MRVSEPRSMQLSERIQLIQARVQQIVFGGYGICATWLMARYSPTMPSPVTAFALYLLELMAAVLLMWTVFQLRSWLFPRLTLVLRAATWMVDAQNRLRVRTWIWRGVHIDRPSVVWIGKGVRIASGVRIPGSACIEAGVSIGPYVRLGNGIILQTGVRLTARSLVGDGVHIGAGALIDDSMIAARARISRGASIIASRIDESALVNESALVRKSYVGERVSIPANVVYAGTYCWAHRDLR